MDIFFSLLFLLVTYFMTSVALLQVYIPGGIKSLEEKERRLRLFLEYKKIMGISFVISCCLSGLMFYYFIYPVYQVF
ncbi:hypothetical protein [Aquiflexum lacus]|uniref:hypothetical protein n=1 Tax=Aquiflexum lacus TaxID=2483805 RepID=UPI001E2A6BD2|nr:hypothetical protein [Aquiflexum lacus]